MKFICELCGWVYDEEKGDDRFGIAPGTPFDNLPAHYECPACYMGKEAFNPISGTKETIRRRAGNV